MRKRLLTLLAALAIVVMSALPAAADPSFGAGGSDGSGNNAPNETPEQCHPPGQTDDNPQC
jgi:hypothetical protein